MALQHLRSSTADKRPTPAAMSDGQLAVNTNAASTGLFFKDSAGALVKVGPVHVGTTAPNASPAVGGETGNTVGEQWLDTSGGTYVFKVWDGSAWRSEAGEFVNISGDTMTGALGVIAGSAAAPGVFVSGDTNTGIYSPGADQVAISTNGTERLRITSDGKLGLGTSSPQGTLNVQGGGTSPSLTYDTNDIANFDAGGVQFAVGINSSSPFGAFLQARDNANAARAITLNPAGGNVGIGTTNPVAKLHIADNAPYIQFEDIDNNQDWQLQATAWFALRNQTAATELLRVTTDGKLGLGTSSPSAKLHLTQDTAYAPSLTYGDTCNQIWRSGGVELASSVNNAAPFPVWLQARDNTNASRNILLNPLGGNIGIGTTSPSELLAVSNTAGNAFCQIIASNASSSVLTLGDSDNGYVQQIRSNHTDNSLSFHTASPTSAGNERARIDNSGRLGLGTSSPSSYGGDADNLVIADSAACGITIAAGTSSSSNIFFADGTSGDDRFRGIVSYDHSSDALKLFTNATEKARIDSSGRLLVGTSTSVSQFGVQPQIQSTGTSGAGGYLGLTVFNTNATSAPSLVLGHSKGGSVGTYTASVAGDLLGEVSFTAGNGTDMRRGASIGAWAEDTWAVGDHPARLVFSTTADGASGPTERMRIDSSGKVGIGTTGPAARLEIGGIPSSGTTELFTIDRNDGLQLFSTGYDYTNNEVSFSGNNKIFVVKNLTGSTESLRIDNNGRLLVGTSSVRAFSYSSVPRFQVSGNSQSTSAITSYVASAFPTVGANVLLGRARGTEASPTIIVAGDSAGLLQFEGYDGTNLIPAARIEAEVDGTPGTNDMPGRLVFSTNPGSPATSPTERMRISNGGNTSVFSSSGNTFLARSSSSAGTTNNLFAGLHSATSTTDGTQSFIVRTNGDVLNTNDSYGAISDIKLKENIVDAESQWDDFKAVRFRKYNFKEETGHETHTQLGVIAQELELVSPGLVTETPDLDDDGNDLGTTTKSVKYSVLTKKALVALQEAMERIEQLEAKVAALEAQ